MKIRQGFVSNSSSSSFIIGKSNLTEIQIEQIKNHWKIAKELKVDYFDDDDDDKWVHDYDEWIITIEKDYIKGYTFMNNFPMEDFLVEKIGIDENHIEWDSY